MKAIGRKPTNKDRAGGKWGKVKGAVALGAMRGSGSGSAVPADQKEKKRTDHREFNLADPRNKLSSLYVLYIVYIVYCMTFRRPYLCVGCVLFYVE